MKDIYSTQNILSLAQSFISQTNTTIKIKGDQQQFALLLNPQTLALPPPDVVLKDFVAATIRISSFRNV